MEIVESDQRVGDTVLVWVPHKLTRKKSTEFQAATLRIDAFTKRIVTDEEEWITYNNFKGKRSWSKFSELARKVSKTGITASRVFCLCVWWDRQGKVFYELLHYGQTHNLDLYYQRLDLLKEAIAQKRPALANRREIVFHQDKAKPHTSIVARQKLREFGW